MVTSPAQLEVFACQMRRCQLLLLVGAAEQLQWKLGGQLGRGALQAPLQGWSAVCTRGLPCGASAGTSYSLQVVPVVAWRCKSACCYQAFDVTLVQECAVLCVHNASPCSTCWLPCSAAEPIPLCGSGSSATS